MSDAPNSRLTSNRRRVVFLSRLNSDFGKNSAAWSKPRRPADTVCHEALGTCK
jgi:hypothetical protein